MHFESVALRQGSIGRLRCPSHTTLSLPTDLGSPTTQGVCVLYVVGGAVDVTHMRHRSTARCGAIVAFDAASPAAIDTHGPRPYDIVTLQAPAARLLALRRAGDTRSGLRFIEDASSSPLAACMRLLAEHMQTASEEQLTALYEACVSLLAAEESRLETVAMSEPEAANASPLLRDIRDHIDGNICDPTLTPPGVARKLGISVRYLHKLFAAAGVTFGAYVVRRRLDHVRNALVTGSDANRTIAELARDWGFRDISAFNKAFRKRFGCAPRRLRSRTVPSNSFSHKHSVIEPTLRTLS